MRKTAHQRAEAELKAFGLALPETDLARGWGPTRTPRVRKKMFAVFGENGEDGDALTLFFKLPISAEMVHDLYFVRASGGWFKQHNWMVVHFGPDDDAAAETDTLKSWLLQSDAATAPKRLAKAAEMMLKRAPGGENP